jgi:trk system potassium uptake protein
MIPAIVFISGTMISLLGVLLICPALIDWFGNSSDWTVFAISGGIYLSLGIICIFAGKRSDFKLRHRDGFILVSLVWLITIILGALPFYFSEMRMTFVDSFFESTSGLTTTGSTVISGLDQAPRGILLWRALLQWIGGIGILMIAIAVLPLLKVNGMQLFQLESSNTSEKLFPRVRTIAEAILVTYVILTLLNALLYNLAGMTSFEAVIHALTTISTGGFSTSDASIGHFRNPAIHWVAFAFMIAGSVPFILYVQIVRGETLALWRDTQVRFFIGLLVVFIGILTIWIWKTEHVPLSDSLRLSAFNIASVVTTTGYATTDYGLWGASPTIIFFFLTFVGGCTGSTTGGIKMIRFQIMISIISKRFRQLLYPKSIISTKYNGQTLHEDILSSMVTFFFSFLFTVGILSFSLLILGLDTMTAFSGAATAVANVGPGLGNIIGPAGNFSTLPDTAKWLLSLGMLIGRLEILTLLVIFTPGFWAK